MSVETLTNRLNEELESYSGKTLDGVSEEDVAGLARSIQSEFNVRPGDEYLSFLKEYGGFNFDGFYLFSTSNQADTRGIPSVIEETEHYHSRIIGDENKLIIGQNDLGDLYAFNPETDHYQLIDHEDGTVLSEYPKFKTFIEQLLTDCLGEMANFNDG
jgi:hypothetical protein